MIRALVESAFQTGYLSVESEGLLNQVLATRCYQPEDVPSLASLYDAVNAGTIKREASSQRLIESLSRFKSP
ncbi:conserved hypothetical protein [Trichormus variabilis ATCC 29413]|uniref:Uncharacterized protein n=2 Tax=Anabaena variabilis TaxID=264691 RepID=Q3M3G2_TRIV2|nr:MULTISPECIES: hypothetical protein [Nostocaceae]ABA24474.1 conserved hypothetical protein [Trichormus variabilis ATCC 29413]MBC1217033.1 hypothetical protein [Trichormus variabilis ARAD]MBC1254689.1 hypothetical protein [Trichormus variabilis V5]MBC1267902.1 hypothetical protein [Trichormus variabilis FSR]MBC1302175.1 hypothetical protein [Trichormus variabilis N2B]